MMVKYSNNYQNTSNDVKLFVGLFFLILFVVALIFINENKKQDLENSSKIVYTTSWGDDVCVDVDMWIEDSYDRKKNLSVGYLRLEGKHTVMLRDDRGCSPAFDTTNKNFEIGFSKNTSKGWVNINLLLYSYNNSDIEDTPINVEFSLVYKNNKGASLSYVRNIILKNLNEEVTAVNFRVNDKGFIVPSSINTDHKKQVFIKKSKRDMVQ